MQELIQDKVERSLEAAGGLYHQLVLLVGESGSGKTEVLRQVAEQLGVSPVNLNLELSSRLVELGAKQRILRLPAVLAEIIGALKAGPVIVDNLEILFDQTLQQDPLRLLQGVSRNRRLVVGWNGTFTHGRLVYAETGHPEYRSYDSIDTLLVTMGGMAAIDSPQAK